MYYWKALLPMNSFFYYEQWHFPIEPDEPMSSTMSLSTNISTVTTVDTIDTIGHCQSEKWG